MRIDIMTDIETLGTKADSTVFQVSAIAFDITTGKIYDTFNQLIDIEKEEMIVDGSTIKWWLNTNKELLATLLLSYKAISAQETFQSFHSWLQSRGFTNDIKNVYLWGNGILFDNNMIRTQMEKYGLEYPIFYQNDRDVRTILELASMKSGLTKKEIQENCKDNNETLHNAIDDCSFQIRMVCKCFDIIMDKEEIK